MPIQGIQKVLQTLFTNQRLRDLRVDLARNSIGPKEMSMLGTTLAQGSNLHTLDISDNFFRAPGKLPCPTTV